MPCLGRPLAGGLTLRQALERREACCCPPADRADERLALLVPTSRWRDPLGHQPSRRWWRALNPKTLHAGRGPASPRPGKEKGMGRLPLAGSRPSAGIGVLRPSPSRAHNALCGPLPLGFAAASRVGAHTSCLCRASGRSSPFRSSSLLPFIYDHGSLPSASACMGGLPPPLPAARARRGCCAVEPTPQPGRGHEPTGASPQAREWSAASPTAARGRHPNRCDTFRKAAATSRLRCSGQSRT